MTELYKEALEMASDEYLSLYSKKMKKVESPDARASAVNMVMMRARDLEKELNGEGDGPDTFNLSAYDFEENCWKYCPCCGAPEIQQKSREGKDYLGCKKCGVLLNMGQIKLMKKPRK